MRFQNFRDLQGFRNFALFRGFKRFKKFLISDFQILGEVGGDDTWDHFEFWKILLKLSSVFEICQIFEDFII